MYNPFGMCFFLSHTETRVVAQTPVTDDDFMYLLGR